MTAPSLRLIASADRAAAAAEPVASVVLIGNYPPRRCGIATFTADVRDALVAADPALDCDVIAMTDEGGEYAYPPEVGLQIRQNDVGDYLRAAARINAARPDVVCVQHEFGIFGGSAGQHLLTLLEAIDRPVVSCLHTVLEHPDVDQRRVFERLIARSSRLVVMAERGREFLQRVWGVEPGKIQVIPHGAPDRPLTDPAPFKVELGFEGRELLFTFGLLSPNKGIETAIRALPAIVAERPDALYVVLGATHPHLVAREGERYRDSLRALADDLGVGEHLRLVDAYADTDRLIEYLQAADVYITPYLNREQITSGTLSYAAALGKPIVSTPYWHAEELLAEGRGRLTPFGDVDAISREVVSLLADPAALQALRERTYEAGRATIWPRFAERHLALFADVAADARRAAPRRRKPLVRPAPSLAGVRRMSDSCGMLQHSVFGLPDRDHGYCVDDNARALILVHRFPGAADVERHALATTYASFVQHAWNPDEGSFRNFMAYDRAWLEARGSQDSNGRSFWALAVTAAEAERADHRRWAAALLPQVLPHLDREGQPLRTDAFVVLGLCALVEAGAANVEMREAAARLAQRIATPLRDRRAAGLPWVEDFLSYDNARLAEALIRAGLALGDDDLTALGLGSLRWLCAKQTSPLGHFLPVATVDFGRPLDAGSLFDQQPLEAAATIDACEAAFRADGDRRWIAEAERAYDWYLGLNDLGVSLEAGEGECYDGLTWCGANQNQGAESVLSYQLAACTLRKLTGDGRTRLKTAGDS